MQPRTWDPSEIKFFSETSFKQTEIGEIPQDWEVKKLEEVAEVTTGGSAPQGENFFQGTNPFIRVQHISQDSDKIINFDLITDEAVRLYNLKLFPKGTIIFPKSGASIYLEKRAVLPMDAYIVSHLCAVNSIKPEVFQPYLFYALKNIDFAINKADGYPTLNLSEVKCILIPIPPLPEQKAIAFVLSAVQEAKDRTEDVIKALRELKKSLMKHLFTYGAVPIDQLHKVKLKQTEIGEIPQDWEVKKLEEVAEVLKGKKPDELHESYEDGALPYLTAECLRTGIAKQFALPTNKVILATENDIIFIWDGSNAGDVFTGLNGILASTMIKITPKHNLLLKEILYSYLKTKFELFNSQTTGSTIPHVNKTIFYNLPIPIPPLPEQKAIAEILSAVDERIEAEISKKQALNNLFQSLLHELMNGKIRVKGSVPEG